jgi:hypothetical protein
MNNTIKHLPNNDFLVLPLARTVTMPKPVRIYHVIDDDTSYHVLPCHKVKFEWIPLIIFTGTCKECHKYIDNQF